MFESWTILSLRWPKSMGYYPMIRSVYRYFNAAGWRLVEHGGDFEYAISKNGVEFLLACYHDTKPLRMLSIKDMTQHRKHNANVILVGVACRPPEPHLVREALDQEVFIIHYKALDRLIALDTMERSFLRKIVLDSLSKV